MRRRSPTRRRAIILGDVGPVDNLFHVGDEAMTERAVAELRDHGWVSLTVVSANPADTAARYDVDAVPRDVVTSPEALDTLLDDVDLVVVAGGGNLNDIWPEHVSLRLLLCEAAAAKGIDVVISGQGLGPFAVDGTGTSDDVKRLLDTARIIGVRDAQSYLLVRSWGIPTKRLFLGPDDTMFAGPLSAPITTPTAPYVVASFSQWHGDLATPSEHLDVCTALVEDLHSVTGLPVVLVPQEGSLEENIRVADVAFHDEIVERVGIRVATSTPITSTYECRNLIRDAELVLSSRFHPVVFALGEGVPAIGVAVDHYTHAKLAQVLCDMDDLNVRIPAPLFRREDSRAAIELLWSRRGDVRAQLAHRRADVETSQRAWWDVVTGNSKPAVLKELRRQTETRLAHQTTQSPSSHAVVRRLVDDSSTLSRLGARAWATRNGARRYIASLETHLAVTREQLATANDYARTLRDELTKRN